MGGVIGFDLFKEIPERDLVFDRAIKIGDHPGSEGYLDNLNMFLDDVRGEDLSLETDLDFSSSA